jgi:hypothetical protein
MHKWSSVLMFLRGASMFFVMFVFKEAVFPSKIFTLMSVHCSTKNSFCLIKNIHNFEQGGEINNDSKLTTNPTSQSFSSFQAKISCKLMKIWSKPELHTI